MTQRSERTRANPVAAADPVDTSDSAQGGAWSVHPAAAFLAGELLSRAQARANAAGLVPSDLRGYEARPEAWRRTGFFLCVTRQWCQPLTLQIFKCGDPSNPDIDPSPLTPERPVPPEPDPPMEPDAPDR
jgi:hypothetical protein